MAKHGTETTTSQTANVSAGNNPAQPLPAEGSDHAGINKRKAFAFAAALIVVAAAVAVAWTVCSPAPSNPSTQNADNVKPAAEPNDSAISNNESASADATSTAETSEPAAPSTSSAAVTTLAPDPADNTIDASTGEAGTSTPSQQHNPSAPANADNITPGQANTESGKHDSSKAPDNDIKAG